MNDAQDNAVTTEATLDQLAELSLLAVAEARVVESQGRNSHGGQCLGDLRALWTVAHLGMRHNLYFSSTNPQTTRLHLRDAGPDDAVLVSMYYGQPNRVEVYVRGERIFPIAEPTWDDPTMATLDTSMPSGTNIWDRIGSGPDKRPGYLHVVVRGPTPVELRVAKKIKLTKYLEVGEQRQPLGLPPRLQAHELLLRGGAR